MSVSVRVRVEVRVDGLSGGQALRERDSKDPVSMSVRVGVREGHGLGQGDRQPGPDGVRRAALRCARSARRWAPPRRAPPWACGPFIARLGWLRGAAGSVCVGGGQGRELEEHVAAHRFDFTKQEYQVRAYVRALVRACVCVRRSVCEDALLARAHEKESFG